MAHTDPNTISSLDALIDISDAAARATMVRLRERIDRSPVRLEQRLVFDGRHRKPVLAFYRNGEAILHVYPEPNIGTGLHLSVPVRTWERRMLRTDDLPDWLREAIERSRPKHDLLWVDLVLRQPGRVDALFDFLLRKADLQPTYH